MTCQKLTTALLRYGTNRLADLWRCDQSEVSRRLNGQRNIPIDDICAACDELGIRLVTPDEDMILMPREELNALMDLAQRYLARRKGPGDV